MLGEDYESTTRKRGRERFLPTSYIPKETISIYNQRSTTIVSLLLVLCQLDAGSSNFTKVKRIAFLHKRMTGGPSTPLRSLSQNLTRVNLTFWMAMCAYLFHAFGWGFIEHMASSSRRWSCIHVFLALMIVVVADTIP